jgi:hypothetical protein
MVDGEARGDEKFVFKARSPAVAAGIPIFIAAFGSSECFAPPSSQKVPRKSSDRRRNADQAPTTTIASITALDSADRMMTLTTTATVASKSALDISMLLFSSARKSPSRPRLVGLLERNR